MSGQDWIEALREACDRQTQARVAKLVGYSPATISQVLKGTYRGDMASIEGAVRGGLMGGTVTCPALMQEIPTNRCLSLQRRPFSFTNAMVNRIRRHCRSGECPHSRIKPAEAEEDDDALV
jgi:DNA-binding transcriptional regulator YdaS (Cro superfamily)